MLPMIDRSLNRRRWTGVIAFWILFVGSIVFVRRYPWLDTAWNTLWAALVIVVGFYSVREMFRRAEKTGEYVYYRGVPRFLWWFVMSDEEYEKHQGSQHNSENIRHGPTPH
jgi:hypothetical protein